MTPAASRLTIDEQNPWPGLSAFDEAAERFFNGRREESAALRRLVTQAPLTVLFGASGLGKTSLVRAGLFPLLRKDVLPVYVRVDLRDLEAPLIDQVKAALRAEVAQRRVDAPQFGASESLWEYLHRTGLEFWSEENQLLTPLFVFDQFEEVFTLGAGNASAVARLRTDLADLIENRLPASLAARIREKESASAGLALDNQRYKLLLSFREDFLAALEGWKRDIPSIMRNRLRLLPMSAEQAFEAVNTTAPRLAPEPIARRIVAFVAAAGEDSVDSTAELEVAPALLSLVCHGLNERRKQQGKDAFDDALLTGTGQAIVTDFYRNAVAGLPETLQRFIERELITERGFRKPCDIDDARTLHGVTDKDLALLVDRRVLRIEPVRGTERVELTHDLLTRVVREQRERRRERDKRRRRLTGAGVALAVIATVMTGLYLWADKQRKEAAEQKMLAIEQRNRAEQFQKLLAELGVQQKVATTATQEKERQARASLSHQLAGAAINTKGSALGILFALNALEVARDGDDVVLRDAQEALRETVDGMYRATAPPGIGFNRPGHTQPITRVEFSPDGSRVATWGEDGVRIWNVAQQDEILTLPNCAILEFSQDGKRLACGSRPFGVFMDVETGKLLMPKVGAEPTRTRRAGYNLTQMSFSPDGKLMLWGSPDETNVTDGASLSQKFAGGSAVFSADGKTLTTILSKTVKFWDVASGSELSAQDQPKPRDPGSTEPTEIRRTTVTDASLIIEDLRSKTIVTLRARDTHPVQAAAFSPDGTRVVTSGGDGRAWVWDAASGRRLSTLAHEQPVFSIAYSPDGNRVATAGMGPVAKLWDAHTGQFLRDLNIQRDRILAVAFSPDSQRIVTAGNGNVFIWNAANGANLTANPLTGFAAAFSGDGRRFALIGSQASIHDAASFNETLKIPGDIQSVGAVAMTHDGQFLAIAESGGIRLWRQGGGWQMLPGTGSGGRSSQITFAFSRDGKRLVTPGTGNTVRIWDTATAKESATLYYADNDVKLRGVAFSADEKQIIAAGENWSAYRFATPLPDFNADARRLVIDAKVTLTDDDCSKYLHQAPCPAQLRRIP